MAGEAVRLLVEGPRNVKGLTMDDKLAWIRRHGEEPLRKALMVEPRGHAGTQGALLTARPHRVVVSEETQVGRMAITGLPGLVQAAALPIQLGG